jgi:hypothetical protein
MYTSRDISVGTVGLNNGGVVARFLAGARDFLLSTASRLVPEPNQPHVQPEVGHSPPSTSKLKNVWSCISTPLCISMEWYLIRH